MDKFCKNCGARLDENAKICGQCGTPIEGMSASNSGIKIINYEKKKKIKKQIKKAMMLLIVLIVLIAAVQIVSKFTGYNGLLRKVMSAYKKYDIETLVSLSSDIYYYADEEWADYYFESEVGYDLDDLENAVGHSYKFSYEIKEIYTLSERKLAERLEKIEYSYQEFDVGIIEKIAIAELAVKAEKGTKSATRDIRIIMSKEGKEWRLLYIE